MSDIIERSGRGGDQPEEGRDPRLHELLVALDPGRADAGYWPRFHRLVLQRAASELARRRARAELSVSELVSSWARTVVPGALLAAAAAGILLLDLPASPLDDDDVLGVEEVLTDGLEGEPIPAQVADEALPEGGGALLAAEIF